MPGVAGRVRGSALGCCWCRSLPRRAGAGGGHGRARTVTPGHPPEVAGNVSIALATSDPCRIFADRTQARSNAAGRSYQPVRCHRDSPGPMPTNPSPAPCWHQRTCPEPRSWPGALEAAAADASAGDPDEGLYWPGSASPVKLSSPLHLHKCWPGAYTVILAVVPPCAGECRSVRVTSVLIFAPAPGLRCLCVGPTPGRPGTSARSRIAPRPPLRASRTRHPACRHRRAGPGRTVVPHRNAAHRQTRRRRTTRTL
jgi:hypothetical protein